MVTFNLKQLYNIEKMEIGQLVIIKTEGLKNVPTMQVKRIEEVPESLKVENGELEDKITCFWFDNNSVYREQVFTVDEIEIFEPRAFFSV